MMDHEQRINQFKTMAEADPDNELGHFSLGKALLEAERFDEAIPPLTRALEINPRLSKAYHLLGEAHEKAGRHEEAIEITQRGVTTADQQGDLSARDAMAAQLTEWGAAVPSFKQGGGRTAEVAAGGTAPGFRCSRCGRPMGKLEKAPFKGKLGEAIFENVCATCWKEWIPMGTKVINELGLVLSSPAGSQAYDQYMIEFLQLEDKV